MNHHCTTARPASLSTPASAAALPRLAHLPAIVAIAAIVAINAIAGGGCASGSGATSAKAGAFAYARDGAPAGTLYRYIKSNRDGTRRSRLETFIASPTRMEVLKLEQGSNVAAYVTVEMDWKTFSPARMESFHIHADGERELMASLAFRPRERMLDVNVMGRKQTLRVEHLPYHPYNFDFNSLNFAFRHLVDPEGTFAIGNVDPNWPLSEGDPRIMIEKGTVTVAFEGQVEHRGRPARRYRAYGPGLGGQEGFIVVDAEGRHIVLMEFPLPTNPDFHDLRLELQSIERMDPAAWQRWMADEWQAFSAELAREDG